MPVELNSLSILTGTTAAASTRRVHRHERRFQDTDHAMKGAIRTFNVPNAPFRTSAMS